MLVQSASLILRAGVCDDPLARWATDLAKTRGKKIAAVALARKLAGVLRARWRDGTVYDPGFQARESAKGIHKDAQSQQLGAQAMALVAKKIQRRERTPSRASRAKTSRVAAM